MTGSDFDELCQPQPGGEPKAAAAQDREPGACSPRSHDHSFAAKVHRLGPRARRIPPPPPELALPARVFGAGYELRVRNYDWHGLQRGPASTALIQLTVGGEGRVRYEQREHVLVPGTALVVHWPHDSRYWLPKGCRWEFMWLCMGGSMVMRLWKAIAAHAQGLVAPEPAVFADCLEEVASVVSGDRSDPLAASAVAYRLTLALHTAVMSEAAEDLPAGLRTAQDFALGHLGESIGVEDLADVAGMSRAHFSRCFRRSVGRSPGAWLIEQRLALAAELLATSGQSLAEVAVTCGFADANYFGKAFRRLYGVTPGSYRQASKL